MENEIITITSRNEVLVKHPGASQSLAEALAILTKYAAILEESFKDDKNDKGA